ncbi:hypothetical protein EUTSA_v10012135mg [Eutrema salsugineum]|uniref:Uncharacterized protein n=1 Tax=Eutrema salsugineum TaxID=72664 RepID=V4JX77_EUTSA|nr:hypothetical protein EUTSA_v10012135mg [Eutrema salsugineum]
MTSSKLYFVVLLLINISLIVIVQSSRVQSCLEDCSIGVYQVDKPKPLPDGTPVFAVEINNQCDWKCKISHIHINCGNFSSLTPVDPHIFRRLSYDNCLVNDGKPLAYGASLTFTYASRIRYSLPVSQATCPH